MQILLVLALLVAAAGGAGAYYFHSAYQRAQLRVRQCESELRGIHAEHDRLLDSMHVNHQRQQTGLERDVEHAQQKIEALLQLISRMTFQEDNQRRDEWLRTLDRKHFTTDAEIDAKLIYPLLKYLGYDDDDIRIQHTIPVRAGTQTHPCAVDWIVGPHKKRFLIEVIGPQRPLDEEAQSIALSYANALYVYIFVITNGTELRIFHREKYGETCVFSCAIADIGKQWSNLKRILAHGNVTM